MNILNLLKKVSPVLLVSLVSCSQAPITGDCPKGTEKDWDNIKYLRAAQLGWSQQELEYCKFGDPYTGDKWIERSAYYGLDGIELTCGNINAEIDNHPFNRQITAYLIDVNARNGNKVLFAFAGPNREKNIKEGSDSTITKKLTKKGDRYSLSEEWIGRFESDTTQRKLFFKGMSKYDYSCADPF